MNDNIGDNKILKKVMTYKEGKFVFSLKYDKDKIFRYIIEATMLLGAIKDIPILPDLMSRLEDELIRKSIFGTAAIEGNPLTEVEVSKVLDRNEKEKIKERAKIQIDNLRKAYNIIKNTSNTGVFRLEEELVKEIHACVTVGCEDEDNTPGEYRNHDVKVGDKDHGGVYVPPKNLVDIKKLMNEFYLWINSDEMLKEDRTIRAALTHYHFALVHPFGNGNGRTARIIEALLLKTSGIRFVPVMLSNYYYRNLDDYFLAFSLAEKNKDFDMTPFLEFFYKAMIESLHEIKNRIYSSIHVLALRDYYRHLVKSKFITNRQYDLIVLLTKNRQLFTLQELQTLLPFSILYKGYTERTVRRDVNKLKQMNLVSIDTSGKYSLNYEILDGMEKTV